MLELVERTLSEVLAGDEVRCEPLHEAMRYAVGTGGKRIRPLICLASAVAVGGRAEDAKYPAAAIELLHNYTLVHDDLPAMDNDRERRGKPSVWAKFGEANAILAGDALLALAYRVAAKAPRKVAEIVDALGEKGVGVVEGQVADLKRDEDRRRGRRRYGSEVGVDDGVEVEVDEGGEDGFDVEYVYGHKTSDLFVAAAAMGGYAGGGSEAEVAALKRFAFSLGMAFQFEDDLLDGDSPYDRATTERKVRECTDAAKAALGELKGDVTMLGEIAERLVGRTK